MKMLILMFTIFQSISSQIIFEFNDSADLKKWIIVDDTVMGGKSKSKIKLDQLGNGVFEGSVSTKNYGGFSSARLDLERKQINNFTKIRLHIKGDGKNYQIRIKTKKEDFFSYTASFQTTKKWEFIEIPLESMSPTFRGRSLEKPNFSENYFEQISLFIGNKKDEDFKLMIKKIDLI